MNVSKSVSMPMEYVEYCFVNNISLSKLMCEAIQKLKDGELPSDLQIKRLTEVNLHLQKLLQDANAKLEEVKNG